MAKKSETNVKRRVTKKAPVKKGKTVKKLSTKRQSSPAIAKSPSPNLDLHKHFRFQRPAKHPIKLPSVWYITQKTSVTLWDNKRVFLAIAAWYAALNLIFVQGLTSSDNTSNLKYYINHIKPNNLGSIVSNLGKFVASTGTAAGSTNSTSQSTGIYQFAFAVIISLATIWALRQLLSGTAIRIREAFYKGMYPLIPFMLVLLVICIQLIPFIIGAELYYTVTQSGIAVHFIERLFWLVLLIVLILWSLYMLSSTVFALYIVTLPDMAPMKALRSARNLVRHRRWVVIRKVLFLPLILLIVASIIMLPFIIVLPSFAPWILFLLTMVGLVVVHSYMYTLYRELLNE